MVSFSPVSPPEPCAHLSPPPYAPHAPPISFFSILPPVQYWVRSTDRHALIIFNTYCFSTATMVTRTRLIATLDVHCPSYVLCPERPCIFKRHTKLRIKLEGCY